MNKPNNTPDQSLPARADLAPDSSTGPFKTNPAPHQPSASSHQPSVSDFRPPRMLFHASLGPLLGLVFAIVLGAFALNEFAYWMHLPSLIPPSSSSESVLERAAFCGVLAIIIATAALIAHRRAQRKCEQQISKFSDYLCEHIGSSRPFERIDGQGFLELEYIASRINKVLDCKHKQQYFAPDGLPNIMYMRAHLDSISPSVRADFCVINFRICNFSQLLRMLAFKDQEEFITNLSARLSSFSSMLSCAFLASCSAGEYLLVCSCKNSLKTTISNIYTALRTCLDAAVCSYVPSYIKLQMGAARLDSSSSASIAKAHQAMINCDEKWCLHAAAMDEGESEQLAKDLANAITEGTLCVHYQPKLNAFDEVIGAEALARWKREGEQINTESFIRLAERNGLIAKLERLIIALVCKDIARLKERGLNCPISVNISAQHLSEQKLLEYLCEHLSMNNLEFSDIELELTEREPLSESAQACIRRLSNMGFSISLDDFGKDYNGLERLSVLPINVIKVDKMFVDGLLSGAANHDIAIKVVKGIINMAKDLGKQTVAEGVESAEQIEILKELGCDAYQGFYHYKAMDFEDFCKVLESKLPEKRA